MSENIRDLTGAVRRLLVKQRERIKIEIPREIGREHEKMQGFRLN